MKNICLSFIVFLMMSALVFSGVSYSKGPGAISNQNKAENFGDFVNDNNHGQQIKDINIQKNQEKQEIQNEFKNEIQEKNEIKNNGGSEEETTNEQNQIDQLKQEKKDINKEYTNELKANGKENNE
ncbi:hypothetical protein V4762_07170 [Thermodesulfobium sp. 4217-1]|uniref:hypothetical protein n=1 Tax=Thermodesulfobium sp. 4217-1 TaxID=3120013 RepID=UPI00322207FA